MARALVAIALLAIAGCAASDESCDEVRDHVAACYGDEAADAFAAGATCEPAHTSYLLSLDCEALANAATDRKADDAIGAALAEAIREGLRVALAEAFDIVYAQLADLGIDRDAFRPFVLLSRHDTLDDANLKRNELSQILDPRHFSPVVVRSGDGYDVIHGACPIDAPALVAEQIADAIVGSPSFLPAIGAELVIEPTETGQSIEFPLSLVLFGTDVAAGFGCEDD